MKVNTKKLQKEFHLGFDKMLKKQLMNKNECGTFTRDMIPKAKLIMSKLTKEEWREVMVMYNRESYKELQKINNDKRTG